MQITKIELFQKDLPVKGGAYTFSTGSLAALDTTLVKITADTGHVGWGETCPLGTTYQPQHAAGARAALTVLAPAMIGANPSTFAKLHRQMNATLEGHAYAKAAIDIACHDLTARHRDLRVADLIGGAVTDTVPSYYATGIGTPDQMAKLATEKCNEGYKRLQIKVGGRPIATDIAVTRAVVDAIGTDMLLAVDANRAWSLTDTIHFSNVMRDTNLIIEQPVSTVEEMTRLKGRLNHPLFIDENSDGLRAALTQLEQGLCDGFGLKLTRIGGLFPLATLRDVCETQNIPHTIDDGWGGDIMAAACAHMGATINPKTFMGTWIAQPYITEHYDPENAIKLQNGHITLPNAPGLGITPNEDQFTPVATYS